MQTTYEPKHYEQLLTGIVFHNDLGEIISANIAAQKLLGFPIEKLLNKKLEDLDLTIISSSDKSFSFKHIRANKLAALKREPVLLEIVNAANHKLWVQLETIFEQESGNNEFYTILTDLTQHKQNEEKNRLEKETLLLIDEINSVANQGQYNLETIIQLFHQRAKDLFNVDNVSIYLLDKKKEYLLLQNLLLPLKTINHIEKIIGGKLPTLKINLQFSTFYASVLKDKIPIITNDIQKIRQMAAEHTTNKALKLFAPLVIQQLNFRSVLSNPLIYKGEPIGLMDMSRNKTFSDEDLERFKYIADQVTLIINRKITDELLAESEEKFRNIFSHAADGIIVIDENLIVREFNPSFIKIFNGNPPEIIGEPVIALIEKHLRNPEDIQHSIDAFQKLINQELVDPFVVHLNNATLEVAIKRAANSKNTVAIIRDISSRIRAANKIKEEEEKNRLLLNSTSDGIIGIDQNNRLIFANTAALNMLQYSNTEINQSSIHKLIHGKHADGSFYADEDCLMNKALKEGISYKTASEVLWRKDGLSFPVEYSATPIKKENKTIGVVIVFRDISERKRNELELLEAKQKAEESNRLKSAFLATMSHELRTPLNSIIGFSDIIQNNTAEKETEEMAEVVLRSGVSLLQIIEDIFDLAMVEKTEINIREEVFSVKQLFGEIHPLLLDFLTNTNKTKKIKLNLHIPEELKQKQLISDKSKIAQVVINLSKNAIKYTEKGTIELGCLTPSPEKLVIYVKDTGIGIPDDKKDIIFEFFRQVDDTHTRKYGGVGIGLAISKKIALAMHGDLSVKSEIGKGSIFEFSFPIKTST